MNVTKEDIKSAIKAAYDKMNNGDIDTALYEAIIDTLCKEYGTEFIAELFI